MEQLAEVVCNFAGMVTVALTERDENTLLVAAWGSLFCIDFSVMLA